ncbi:CHAT domain-containing protein [Scytonema sp. NUACC26]|uniref:CHAT domain-containing protein n=1 Tax=Scytonema sp. NUACC26 TaxID=3140176 RepID=UPI0038B40F23
MPNVARESNQEPQKILVLAAIPNGLRLDKEIREIVEAIKRAVKRDSFDIKIITAVQPRDIRRAIAEERPSIVHFCGHGLEDGSLLLEDESGNHKPVSPRGLVSLFRLHAERVKCVLLNACYSSSAAEAIGQHVNYVIGMNQPIQDRAAIVFAQGFYDGLGYDNIDKLDVIQRAFDEGIVAIELENLLQGIIPSMWKLGIAQKKIESTNQNEDESSNLRDYTRIQQTDDLSSDRNVDYTQLRNLLSSGNWKDADYETYSILLKVMGCEEGDWISDKELLNFPQTFCNI